jgi:hypothetical protein
MDIMKILKSPEKLEQIKDIGTLIRVLDDECEWSINPSTGLIDVVGDVNLNGEKLKSFSGLKFGVVTGQFDCSYNDLTSLVGAPRSVGGDFDCSNNDLTSLVGAPQSVGGDFFDCSNNDLTSLVGAPQSVEGDFYCHKNKIKSLVGAPKKLKGEFHCEDNNLTSLEGIPKGILGLYCGGKELINLDDLPLSLDIDSFNMNKNRTMEKIAEIMLDKKISFFGALCLAKDEISKYKFNKICKINGFEIKEDAIRTYSIISRFTNYI